MTASPSAAPGCNDALVITAREKLRLPGPVVMRCAQGRDGVLWLRAGDSWVRIET